MSARSVLADQVTSKAGRPRWWVAGLSLSVLLVVGLLAWRVLDGQPYVAPLPTDSAPRAQPALAAQTLQRLEQAVSRGDVQAAQGLAPADDTDSRALLAALATNARALEVRNFALRYVDETGGVAEDGSWSASVDVGWQFARFDPVPAQAEVQLRFEAPAEEGGEVTISDLGGGDLRTPVWLSGPVQVRRTPTTLVLAATSASQADAYASRARSAVPAVQGVLPGWQPRLVVEVPASAPGLDAALDATPGEYAGVAAVTTTVDGSLASDAPVHVFVNPEVFGQLQRRGAQVVMTHEAAHVATEAAMSTMPLWLVEGFADYVALRDVDLPLSVTAGQIIRQVRRAGVPEALPGVAEFDTTTTHLGAAYEAAWLACRLLAQVGGEQALVRLYGEVDAGRPLGASLRENFGLGTAELTARWQTTLSDLAA